MKHLQKAFEKVKDIQLGEDKRLGDYIKLDDKDHSVKFLIQEAPVNPFGVNGCQVINMTEFIIELLKSLNEEQEANENNQAIKYLNFALDWQYKRKDRIRKGLKFKDCYVNVQDLMIE